MSYDLDEIKAKVSLLDVIQADGHQLKRAGARWVGNCMFHEERTGSFSLTESTMLFKCFGCGAGGKGSEIKGDLFGYWMATRGVDFHTVAGQLAALAGTGQMPDGLSPKKRTGSAQVSLVVSGGSGSSH